MARKPVIAAQLYTLRDFFKTPEDIAKNMPRVRKAGYDAAQISGGGLMSIDPAELRSIMLDAGVRPIGAHVALDLFRTDLPGVIDRCHKWGITYVAIPCMDFSKVRTLEAWKSLAREFNGFGKTCAQEGLILQYHNHMFEFEKYGVKKGIGGRTALDILYSSTNPAFLQAELDLGWVARGNENPIAWIRKMAGRLDQVHLKDWGIVANEPIWREIGEGGICWPCVFKACKVAGTNYYIVEQDTCLVTQDPFLSLSISRKNIKAMGLG